MRCEKKEWTKTRRDTQTPTAGAAYNNIRREEKLRDAETTGVISRLIPVMKQTAELAGFEGVGRVTLKDKETGKKVFGGKQEEA